jgi:nucleotide-binding universal stress UspA family protein
MAYKTILVHADAGVRTPVRLAVAAEIATRFEAHLIGLNAVSAMLLPGYVAAEGGAVLAEAQARAFEAQSQRARTLFDKAVAATGLTTREWRVSEFDAAAAITQHARYADLVVIGQPDAADQSGVDTAFAEATVLGAGRPVLMVPFAGPVKSVGQRVLVAWNATREAARAMTDAIPLLRRAAAVKILAINPGPLDGALPAADIALYLARHGVRAEAVADRQSEVDVGNELLSRAADFDSDLIVMGAYGHSRLREIVMGGATRTILSSMTVPVLMSH